MQANLPMGGNKVTGAADPTVATDLATKNYIDALVASFFSTGDAKLTFKTTADTGWVMANDGTIGDGLGSVGYTCRGNLDTQALFTLLYNNVVDAWAPVFTSNGTATTRAALGAASAAFAAHAYLLLPKALGRAIAISGSGSGLTARALGQALGVESRNLLATDIPTITSVNAAQSITVNFPGQVGYTSFPSSVTQVNVGPLGATTTIPMLTTNTAWSIATASAGTANNISVTYTNASQTGATLMQPTFFVNCMIKL